jgi:hypothetical protein
MHGEASRSVKPTVVVFKKDVLIEDLRDYLPELIFCSG